MTGAAAVTSRASTTVRTGNGRGKTVEIITRVQRNPGDERTDTDSAKNNSMQGTAHLSPSLVFEQEKDVTEGLVVYLYVSRIIIMIVFIIFKINNINSIFKLHESLLLGHTHKKYVK